MNDVFLDCFEGVWFARFTAVTESNDNLTEDYKAMRIQIIELTAEYSCDPRRTL